MEIKYKKHNSALTVYVYGELDEYSAQSARGILDKLLYDNLSANKVVFDLSGISFMDSTGIGLLIGRYKKLKQFNIPSYITGATVATEKVIELAGLYKIMPKS
jgi:stage II sporulation protein AA (anti-sigma F factor antagonist)